MKFFFVTFDFPPSIGGIETRVVNYIDNLIKKGHQVSTLALTLKRHEHVLEERFNNTTVYRAPSSSLASLKVFFSIRKILEKNPFDVIHILTGGNTIIGMLFLLYGKLNHNKVGIFLYGKDIKNAKKKPVSLLLLHAALIFSSKIGVNSKATAKLLPNRFLFKTHVLYPGVNIQKLQRYKTPRITESSVKKVLFVGRLIKRKGVDDLIKAFKLLNQEVPNTKLIIVGNGSERNYLKNLVKELGIMEKVEFTGSLKGEELYLKYKDCDVFVMPSKKLPGDVEGFGIVFLEAGFFGKPSVGTWSGGIPEAVIHNKTGILVPEDDISALKNAIKMLLTNEELARKLGENARKRVMGEFSWEKATERLLKMYLHNKNS